MPKDTQSPESVESLLHTLRDRVLVWAEQWGTERVVVARPGEHELVEVQEWLPPGVQAVRRELNGPPLSTKGPRSYANYNLNILYWPADALRSKRSDTLVCVVKGETDFPVGDLLLHCKEGDFIFILAGVPYPDGTRPHLEGSKEDKQCSLLWLASGGAGSGLGCWMCHSKGNEHFAKPSESCYIQSEHVLNLFNILMYESNIKRSLKGTPCNHLLRALLALVCQELEAGNFFQFLRTVAEKPLDIPLTNPIGRAQDYIRSHLNRRLTIDEVASHVYLSRAHFTKLFRRESGKSFVEYVNECRVEEAKKLLKETEWSVLMICRALGLAPSRFRSIFHEYVGMSPIEFRYRYRTETENTASASDTGGE